MAPEAQSNTPRPRYLAAACLVLAAALLVFYVCYLLLAFSPRVDHWLPGTGLRLLLAGLVGLVGPYVAAGVVLSRMRRMPRRTGGARSTSRALPVLLSVLWVWALLLGGTALGVLSLRASQMESGVSVVCRQYIVIPVEALQTYAADHGGRLPPASTWCDALTPYGREGFRSHMSVLPTHYQGWPYALNSSLAGTTSDALQYPERTVVMFESDADWNAAGGPELLPDEPRHHGGDHYGFADGHVEWLPRKLLGATWLGNRIWAKEPDADWVIWDPVLKETDQGTTR